MVRFHPLDRHSFMCVLVGQSNSFAHISSYSIFAAFTLRVSYHPFFRYRFSHPFSYILLYENLKHLHNIMVASKWYACMKYPTILRSFIYCNYTQIKRLGLVLMNFNLWYAVFKLIISTYYQLRICKKRCTKILHIMKIFLRRGILLKNRSKR